MLGACFIIALVGFLVFQVFKRLFETPEDKFPYRLRDDFLSVAEHSFYRVLRRVVAERGVVCPKVSLADLFHAQVKDRRRFRAYTNKIDRKHVDFLLCDPQTMRPLAGIELDDQSHQRPDLQERDIFVNGVFAAASLPLVRIPAQHAYSPAELEEKLTPYLRLIETTSQPNASSQAAQPIASLDVQPAAQGPPTNTTVTVKPVALPDCPKCGTAMVMRTAKTGENFWGCSSFPRCRGNMEYKG